MLNELQAFEMASSNAKITHERLSTLSIHVGTKLRALRQSERVSLRSAAMGLGISPSYLSDLERGNRMWPIKLAHAAFNQLTETP